MIGWRRQKSWLALGVVTTIFLITAIYLAGRLYSERDLLLLNYRNGAWVAVQAQTQLLRLEEAVNRYQVEPTVENKEQVSVRLDLLWSRIPLLLDSAVGQAARTISGMVPKLEDLRRQLPDLERELAALAPGDNEAWKRVVTRLRAFYTPLNELVRRILIYDAFSRNRDNLTSAAIELGLAMALILLCGLFSIFLLVCQLRHSEQLRREKERAVAQAEDLQVTLYDGLESIGEAFLLLDGQGRILLVNQRFRESYPVCQDELAVGALFRDLLLHAALRGKFLTPLSAAKFVEDRFEKTRQQVGRWEEQLTDGRAFLVRERATSRGGTVAIYTDITALKSAEALLRPRLEVIEEFFVGIAICDDRGRVSYVNKALTQQLNLKDSQALVRQPWSRLFAVQELNRLAAFVTAEDPAPDPWRGIVRLAGSENEGAACDAYDVGLIRPRAGGLIITVHDTSGLETAALAPGQSQSQQQTDRSSAIAARDPLSDALAQQPAK